MVAGLCSIKRSVHPKTLFSSLSSDELSIVTRQLSAQPRSNFWLGHLSPADLTLLFAVNGPLTSAVYDVFRRLDVNTVTKSGHLNVTGESKNSVVKRIGSSLSELELVERPMRDRQMVADVCADAVQYCGALRKLRVELEEDSANAALVSKLLVSQAATLEELWLVFRLRTDFQVPFRSFLHLRSLRLQDNDLDKYTDIFPRCGTSLKELHVRGDCLNWSNLLDSAQTHARNLNTIIIRSRGSEVPQLRLAELLKSYGIQLLRSQLEGMDAALCADVLTACPKLICSASLYIESIEWFDAVAAYVGELAQSDEYVDGSCEWELLEKSFSRCIRLTELRCYIACYEPKVIYALFASPKPKLRVLNVSARHLTLTSDLADLLIPSLSEVDDLSMKFKRLGDVTTATRIIGATRSLCHLRIVQRQVRGQKEALGDILELLSCVKGFRCLRNVELHFNLCIHDVGAMRNAVTEAVQPFRLRRTRIEVCNNLYLP